MNVTDLIQVFWKHAAAAATLLAAILTVLGSFGAIFAKWQRLAALKDLEATLKEIQDETGDSKTPSSAARYRVGTRIVEAMASREQQLRTHRWSKRTTNLLTTAQYVVGGVLASSFVQESVNPKWAGGLGVLVLIASLFKQQFHPEINADDARKKASKLQALIRSSEDRLAILDSKIAVGQDHSDAMSALLMQITDKLNEIDSPESIEFSPQIR